MGHGGARPRDATPVCREHFGSRTQTRGGCGFTALSDEPPTILGPCIPSPCSVAASAPALSHPQPLLCRSLSPCSVAASAPALSQPQPLLCRSLSLCFVAASAPALSQRQPLLCRSLSPFSVAASAPALSQPQPLLCRSLSPCSRAASPADRAPAELLT
eukprot:gene7276-biopygen1593